MYVIKHVVIDSESVTPVSSETSLIYDKKMLRLHIKLLLKY
jgi:hypothetical protein